MGKQKKQSQPPSDGLQTANPGARWGIMNVLKYHHWHYVKKRLPHWKQGGDKHDTGDETENSGDNTKASGEDELPPKPQQNAEPSGSKVKGKKRNPGPVLKDSVKFLLKAIKEEKLKGKEEKSKRKGKHHRSKTCPEQSQATEMDSDDHLEDPENITKTVRTEETLQAVEQTNESSSGSSSLSKALLGSSEEQMKGEDNSDDETILDEKGKQVTDKDVVPQDDQDDHEGQVNLTIKLMTEDVFTSQAKEIMDALDIISLNKEFLLRILQDPSSPLAQHFQKQQAASAKLALRRCESFPLPGSHGRGVSLPPSRLKSHHDAIGNNSNEGESNELPKHESVEETCKSSSVGSEQNQGKIETPDGFPIQLQKKVGENQAAIKRFKDLKHKIKHVVKERKQERRRITMDAVFHKIPNGKGFSSDLRKETKGLYGKADNFSLPSSRNNRLQHFERSPSLKESMDRYLQLYESSFQKEANQQTPERQISRKEDTSFTNISAKKSLVRIFSSPELHCYIDQTEDSTGALSPDRQINVQKNAGISTTSEYQFHYSPDGLSQIEHETGPKTDQVAYRQSDFLSSQEVDLDTQQNNFFLEAIDYSTSIQVELEKAEIPQVLVDEKDEASFNYVKDVLQVAGFSGNESLGKWHANDQPLDPSMVEEVEGCMLHDPDCPGNEEDGYCSHLIMFDLINEVLLEIYEGSYSYCPALLSCLSNIRPKPVGRHVVEEVWTHISWYLSFRTGKEQGLDYVFSRDLMKKDGWMKLQFDMECVGLELEELIFDGLLKELLLD